MLAIDTNILVYGEGFGDPERCARASDLLSELRRRTRVVPAQVLGELFRVLIYKGKLSREAARARVVDHQEGTVVAPTETSTITAALDLITRHHLQISDAIILAASAEAGCRMLLSEDMQDGFVWRGTTVVNPFAPTPHPLLADLLRH